MLDANPPALPQNATLTQFSLVDGVGRARLDDGTELRIGISALGKIQPIVGTKLHVLGVAPHPLGGFKVSRVELSEGVDAKSKEAFAAAAIHARFAADPPNAAHLLEKLAPELLTSRERDALEAFRARRRAEAEMANERMAANARKKRELALKRARLDAAGPERAWRERLKEGRVSAEAAERIVLGLRPAVRLLPTSEAPDPLGTRFGGMPAMAPSTRWPEHRSRPLVFLAQVRLRELPEAVRASLHLPGDGLLSFFFDVDEEPRGFDPNHAEGGQVLWLPDPRMAEETKPRELPPVYAQYTATAVAMFETAIPAGVESFHFEKSISEEDADAFAALDYDYEFADSVPCHRIGGHPGEVQGGMELECALVREGVGTGGRVDTSSPAFARAQEQAPRWRLLAQLDSDGDLSWEWGDAGRLYFWIHEEDLKQQRFDRAWCLLQCT